MVFYNLHSLSMLDFSALNNGDPETWKEKLEENIQDREAYLATDIRWTWQHRMKMQRELKIYKKALKLLNGN